MVMKNNQNDASLPLTDQHQLSLAELVSKGENLTMFRIGDQVEDILNIAYKMLALDSNIHKIDMRYAQCCTLKDPTLIQKAIEFIDAMKEAMNKRSKEEKTYRQEKTFEL